LADKKKIGLAILNKNEIIGAKELINKIDQLLFNEIICIDGGSTDGSNKFIESKGIKVLQQKSSGRGEAFQLAIREMGERLDGIVFFSLDGNEDPKDLEKFVSYFEKEFDLVIANRMGNNSVNEEDAKFFKPRKWANQLFALLAYLIWGSRGQYIQDPINGYRGLSKKFYDRENFESKKFSIEFETSIRAYKGKYSFVEFDTVEGHRLGGNSTAKSFPVAISLLKIIINESRISNFFNKRKL